VNATVRVDLVSEIRQSENVVGMLEGSDDSSKNQYVVYSAHYDHLGKTPAGIIYHGADDNASGTSTVLGIAETYSNIKIRPKRSIIFLTVSGEEKGLLGSSYFTLHPTVPIKDIVTDLNTDMDGRIDTSYINRDSNYVFVIGSKRLSTELDSLLVSADSESVKIKLDYSFDSDNDPNQFYYRSDHYNFAKKDIPVIFFFDGNHPDYHKPTDTSDKIDFPILEERAKLIFMTGWKVANLDWRLRLN
jgi:Zn-dependent M28 family amino/carboxypeptidase